MARYAVRVWLPDRPGALGAVASRVGAVKADVVGIEVLERGAGLAVDELTVELPDSAPLDLMLAEIAQVDGAAVEEVREVTGPPVDPGVRALEAVAPIVDARHGAALWPALIEAVAHLVDPDWSCVLAPDGEVLATAGTAPAPAWLDAYRRGAEWSDGPATAAPDPVLVGLGNAPAALLVGRPRRPMRSAERSQLVLLGQLAGMRWGQLDLLRALGAHPARGRPVTVPVLPRPKPLRTTAS